MKYFKNKIILVCFGLFSVGIMVVLFTQPDPDQGTHTNMSKVMLKPKKTQYKKQTLLELEAEMNTPNQEKPIRGNLPTPEFKTFSTLVNKTLFSDIDQQELIDLLNDEQLLQTANRFLNKVLHPSFDSIEERARLDSITYINTILSRQYPSELVDDALDIAVDVLLKDNFMQYEDKFLRKSIVGDKIELGISIYLHHPRKWQEIRLYHHNSRFSMILKYIENEGKEFKV